MKGLISMNKKKKETRGRKQGKYYVSNDELVKGVREYYSDEKFTEELGRHVNKIVDGVSHSPNFINYFKEDNPWGVEMYSDAVWRITKSVVDKGCRIIDEELIGTPLFDENNKPVYELDKEGNFVLDENNNKIQSIIKQNNIFGYFSRIAWMAFVGRIKAEKKQQQLIAVYSEKIIGDFETEYGVIVQEDNDYDSNH